MLKQIFAGIVRGVLFLLFLYGIEVFLLRIGPDDHGLMQARAINFLVLLICLIQNDRHDYHRFIQMRRKRTEANRITQSPIRRWISGRCPELPRCSS